MLEASKGARPMGDINWSDILPIVIVASTVLTVAVGLIGLRQGHYRSGKLTRRGRQSVAAIVALGVVTLVSTFADRQISAAKEAADAELRTRQFDRQMASLKGVTGDLGTVRGSLQESLRKQELLYGIASENVRLSGSLMEQTQVNTNNLLRRMFEDGNRISAERIAIFVSARCPIGDRFTDRPRIMTATLVARRPNGSELRLLSGQSGALSGGLFFHGFMGDLGSFETFQGWAGARISIRIMGGADNDGATLEEFNAFSEEDRARFMAPRQAIRCTIEIGLSLNGRQVLSAAGLFERIQGTETGDYEAAFNDLRVDRRRLPRFAE